MPYLRSHNVTFELLEWPDNYGADFAEAFIDEMRKLLPKRRDAEPAPVKPVPLARAAAVVMPFGEHRGKPLDYVPVEYLDWLCREQETFLLSLQTYLRHPDRS